MIALGCTGDRIASIVAEAIRRQIVSGRYEARLRSKVLAVLGERVFGHKLCQAMISAQAFLLRAVVDRGLLHVVRDGETGDLSIEIGKIFRWELSVPDDPFEAVDRLRGMMRNLCSPPVRVVPVFGWHHEPGERMSYYLSRGPDPSHNVGWLPPSGARTSTEGFSTMCADDANMVMVSVSLIAIWEIAREHEIECVGMGELIQAKEIVDDYTNVARAFCLGLEIFM